MTSINQTGYHAVIQQCDEWWIGWVEEIPGVNSQGKTREELLENLRDALAEALEKASERLSSESQRRELERRVAEDEANPDAVVPWEQVKAQALARMSGETIKDNEKEAVRGTDDERLRN